VPGSVLRKIPVEGQRRLEDNLPAIAFDVDDDRGQALGAGVETKIERHTRSRSVWLAAGALHGDALCSEDLMLQRVHRRRRLIDPAYERD